MQANSTYNWDDIEVGTSPNGLQDFFGLRHSKHEKNSELILVNGMASAEITENIAPEIDANAYVENVKIEVNYDQNLTQSTQSTQSRVLESLENVSEIICKVENELILKNNQTPTKTNSSSKTLNIRHKTPPVATENIVEKRQWSTKKNLQSNINGKCPTKVISQPPHAYSYKDIYEKKKLEVMRKTEEQEKRNRLFHSQPVPNFLSCHQQLERKKPSLKVTVCTTPMVLKHSREKEEKTRQKREEESKRNQLPRFTSRKPSVLQEEPFKPIKSETLIKLKPFCLHSEKRLEERKRFDEQSRRAMEEKKKQEEEERKRIEEHEAKMMRKLASFKARPNPFK